MHARMKASATLTELLAFCILIGLAAAGHKPRPSPSPQPQPLHSGYISLDTKPGSALYYAYWGPCNSTAADEAPILLWLQGGPGCASTFGAFYELGPYVTDADGKLVENPFAWNTNFGLLVIDQPVGTGYSIAASEQDIPEDMTGMAQDLYEGLWKFFDAHQELQQRPLSITGESYAGKYIPSIAHYILQVEAESNIQQQQQQQHGNRYCRRSRGNTNQRQQSSSGSSGRSHVHKVQGRAPAARKLFSSQQQQQVSAWHWLSQLWTPAVAQQQQQHQAEQSCWSPKHARPLGEGSLPAPNFKLTGIAIGNGLTDPKPQTRALAGVVYSMGLVSEATQTEISLRTEDIVQLISQGSWEAATSKRSDLLEFIQLESGVATLFDVRRNESYDASKSVDKLLSSAEVRNWMRATNQVSDYNSCSPVVERVMAADVMRSCLVLVEDILEVLPVLLYQGQFDVQDGVASTNAWIQRLRWGYLDDFEDQEGELWYVEPDMPGAAAAGWKRSVSTLTQVVVRNAGHMLPRDQPQAALAMIEQWVAGVVGGGQDGVSQLRRGGVMQQGQRQHVQKQAAWGSRGPMKQRGVATAR